MYVEALYKDIQNNINFAIEHKLLSEDGLEDYANYNVHSVLQYCLVKIENDLFPIPAYKIKLKKPIDKFEIDDKFRNTRNKKKARYQRTIKVDVAYLKDSEIVGFGEVFSPDEIHGVLELKELSRPQVVTPEYKPWITPKHKIEHLIVNTKPKFFIVVNVMNKLPPWGDAKNRRLEEWEKLWIEFGKKVHEHQRIECLHVIIKSIKKVDYYPYVIS
jgi:hypothetical protein